MDILELERRDQRLNPSSGNGKRDHVPFCSGTHEFFHLFRLRILPRMYGVISLVKEAVFLISSPSSRETHGRNA